MVYKSKYSWKGGYTPKVSAEIVGNALDKMKEESETKTVTAEMLLDYSRPEDSETHALFEWNDNVAAEKWRMFQSGRIINQLEVELIPVPDKVSDKEVVLRPAPSATDSTPIKAHAYINIEPAVGCAKRGVYTDVVTAFSNDDMRARVLRNALRELETFSTKYEQYKELADVFSAIDGFRASLEA